MGYLNGDRQENDQALIQSQYVPATMMKSKIRSLVCKMLIDTLIPFLDSLFTLQSTPYCNRQLYL